MSKPTQHEHDSEQADRATIPIRPENRRSSARGLINAIDIDVADSVEEDVADPGRRRRPARLRD
jgi:hypothetical protein